VTTIPLLVVATLAGYILTVAVTTLLYTKVMAMLLRTVAAAALPCVVAMVVLPYIVAVALLLHAQIVVVVAEDPPSMGKLPAVVNPNNFVDSCGALPLSNFV
jgi:hypothetical protein